MNDAPPTLTPQLVVMAIESGMLDDSIDAIQAVLSARKDTVRQRKADHLVPGDQFIVVNVRPKKWEGLTVTFKRREGIWLVVDLSIEDACRLHNADRAYVEAAGSIFREVKLRNSHVGTVVSGGL